jgi:hypothetical protein
MHTETSIDKGSGEEAGTQGSQALIYIHDIYIYIYICAQARGGLPAVEAAGRLAAREDAAKDGLSSTISTSIPISISLT